MLGPAGVSRYPLGPSVFGRPSDASQKIPPFRVEFVYVKTVQHWLSLFFVGAYRGQNKFLIIFNYQVSIFSQCRNAVIFSFPPAIQGFPSGF